MISIGAGSGSRSRSLELRSPWIMLGLSPCPERSWQRARPLRLSCQGASLVLSLLACIEPAEALQNGAISPLPPCQITRHTMQSNFTRKSLKTNVGHPNKVTHFFRTGLPVSTVSRVWEIRSRPGRFRGTAAGCPENAPISTLRRATPAPLATNHSLVLSPVEGSLATEPFHFPLAISESRCPAAASDSLSGGII
jgi:hypothetical protein